MRRLYRNFIFIFVILVVVIATFLGCTDSQNNSGTTEKQISIKVKEGSENSPIEIFVGDTFDPTSYHLIIKRDDTSEEISTTEDMFVSSELSSLSSVGIYNLTVTYYENSKPYKAFLCVIVKEKPVDEIKYKAVFDLGALGSNYIEPISEKTVSKLSRPSHTYKLYDGVRKYEYLDVEWYLSSDFSSSTLVEFPYTLKTDTTFYAKFVDKRKVDIEYYVVRINEDGKEIAATGETIVRDNLTTDSKLNESGYTVSGANLPIGTREKSSILLSKTSSSAISGYTFRGWEIKNSETSSYTAIKYENDNSCKLDILSSYLDSQSSLTPKIKVYLIYDIDLFTVRFNNQDSLFLLKETAIKPNSMSFDVFNNAVENEKNYHLYDNKVYEMEKQSVALENGTFTLNSKEYSYIDGKVYLDSVEVNANVLNIDGNLYYVHVPCLTVAYNTTINTFPYVISQQGKVGAFCKTEDLSPIDNFINVTKNYSFTAVYSIKKYDVKFYRYENTVEYKTLQVEYNNPINYTPTLSTQEGYTYYFVVDGIEYTTPQEISALNITAATNVKENRKANIYKNIFKSGDTTIATIETTFNEKIALPDRYAIVSKVPSYDKEYNDFGWTIEGSSNAITEDYLQPSSAMTFILKINDLRSIKYRYILTGDYSSDGTEKTTDYISLNYGESNSFDVDTSQINSQVKAQYRVTKYKLNGIESTSLGEIIFNSAFIDQWLTASTYDDKFVYSIDIYLIAEKLEYHIQFKDDMKTSNSRTKTYYYGDKIEETFDTTDVTAEDGTIYHFNGWFETKGDQENYLKTFPQVVESATYTAKWKSEAEGTYGLVYELNSTNDAYIVTGYTGYNEDIYIASEYNSLPVVGIGDDAFLIKSSAPNASVAIKMIYLPKSITALNNIHENAFESLVYAENLTIKVVDDGLYQSLVDNKAVYFKELKDGNLDIQNV